MTGIGASASAEHAELVLQGGPVLVMDAAGSRADAVAVAGGRILAVGTRDDVAPLIGAATRVIELDGRAVLPGINDSHLHATWLGARWPHTFFGGHADGAQIEGVLTGDRAARRAAILRAGELLSRFGVTSLTEPGIGPGEDDGETGCFAGEVLDVYRELAEAGELRQRVTLLGLYGILDGPSRLDVVTAGIAELVDAQGGSDPEWLRIAGIKIFGDLIPLSKQAWSSRPYDDGTHGGLLVEGETLEAQAEALREMVRAGHRAGLQVGVHATGDRTIEVVLDAVASAADEPGAPHPRDLGHYVIHGDLATPEQVARIAELGMWFNSQPGIAVTTADWMAGVLGADVAPWPYAEALDAGVLVLSSDAPILAPDWRETVAAAEAWILRGGAPADPAAAAARLHGLLRAHTAVPAQQDRAADWKGTVEAGKVADLVVLAQDPFAVGAAGLPGVEIDLTVLDGNVVFERES